MPFHKFLPTPSERMGVLWSLSSIKDAYIVEFGPAGTTHYGIESYSRMNSSLFASIYTTHIDENDIVMGDTDRLADVIKEVDSMHRPKYIFVVASSISAIIGADIKAVCSSIEDVVDAKMICFTGGGFKGNYNLGCMEVMTSLAEMIVQPTTEKNHESFNIIGSNIDCYNFASDIGEINSLMWNCFGMKLNSVFTADSSISSIEKASNAAINLVLRAEGLPCAEILLKRFDIPYSYGLPYGYSGTYEWIKNIQNVLGIRCEANFLNLQTQKQKDLLLELKYFQRGKREMRAVVCGNYDSATGMADFVENELGIKTPSILINHAQNIDFPASNNEKRRETVKFNLAESQKEKIIEDTCPDLVFADSFLFDVASPSSIKILFSNPNIHKRLLCKHMPYVGFSGADYILEKIINSSPKSYSNVL